MTITPQQIEARLYELSVALDDAHAELVSDESRFHTLTADYEIGLAKSRIKHSQRDMKITVALREDLALVENEPVYRALCESEAKVKASRANVNRLRVQVDIARSIAVSVRASMEIA